MTTEKETRTRRETIAASHEILRDNMIHFVSKYLGYVIGKEKLLEKRIKVTIRYKLIIVYPDNTFSRNDMKFKDAREESNERIDTILRPSASLFTEIEEAVVLNTSDAQILCSQLKGSMIADCYTTNPTKTQYGIPKRKYSHLPDI